MMTNEQLKQAQLAFEKDSINLGVVRYQKAIDTNGEADSIPGMKLMKAAIPHMVEAITEWTSGALEGGTKGLSVVHFANQFPTDMLAYVAVKLAINGAASQLTVSNLAMTITRLLEDQLSYEKLRDEDIKLFRKWSDKVKKTPSQTHRVFLLKRQLKYAGVVAVKWGLAERGRFGAILVELLIESTGLFEKIDGGRKAPPKLSLTPEAEKFLLSAHQRTELLFPVYSPMVVPPKPWTTPFDGGYLTMRTNLVKSWNTDYMDELKAWDMPQVYRAVNALQNTKWQINTGILRLMREVWDGGGNMGGLPTRDPLPIPPRPTDEVWLAMSEEEQRASTRRVGALKEENFRMMSKRVTMISRLSIAEKYSEFSEFYFPHSLDWRGRVYPISGFLHPQSDDRGKALLQFAEGKPLGETGAYWLAVHLANTYGIDKVSFEERVKWVEDNSDMILECAMNPLDGSREWTKADSPWMFLAACMEWMGYAMQGKDYVSHIPVSWDGSCNGLQNFSAMLRDEVGGSATNLVPHDKPADIYSEVATKCSAIVDMDAANGNEEAALWVGKVNRKIAKRPTMTMPYGSGRFGFREQIKEEIEGHWHDHGVRYLDGGDDFHASVYLAGAMYEAISSVVVAARLAMDWLRETAKIASREGAPIHWTTPAGFLVLQDYREAEGQRVRFNIMGRDVRMVVQQTGTKLDNRKQSQGISPNFVHSQDASHMMLTVNACLDDGITAFAMIHDSYGTHAADAEALSYHLRRQFIDQYSGNVLEDFRNEILELVPEEKHCLIPPVPPMGALDLEGIMDSPYFFA